jgi:ribosome biogenesis GTPase
VPSSSLVAFGWTEAHDNHFTSIISSISPGVRPDSALSAARVTRHDRGRWTLITDHGSVAADLRSRLRNSPDPTQHPTVGDWVVVRVGGVGDPVLIEAVLPRASALERGAVGKQTEAQVLAANVDTVLICVPADAPPNPRRVERQLAMVWNCGATPVLVMTKSDLGIDADWLSEVAFGASVVPVDSLSGAGIDGLGPWLEPGRTLVVLGPSGAGKSTLGNALLGGSVLATSDVRSLDRRGRHTTTWRELVMLPSGALLVDTPGIREVELWDASEGLSATFTDVEELSGQCRFHDCAHRNEPGCAVVAALADGSLGAERFENWRGLQRELAFQARRHDARLASEEKKKWAARTREARTRSRR